MRRPARPPAAWLLAPVALNQVLVAFGDDTTTDAVIHAVQRDGTHVSANGRFGVTDGPGPTAAVLGDAATFEVAAVLLAVIDRLVSSFETIFEKSVLFDQGPPKLW